MRTKWREQQAKARVHSLVQELKHLPGQPQKKRRDQTFPMSLVNPEKPDVPLNKNDAFQKVQKRRVQEKR